MSIPVFDSSTIEFPVSSAKSSRGHETHSLIAWGKPSTSSRGTRENACEGTNDRPTSRSSSRGGPTPDTNQRAPASPKLNRNSPVSFQRWAETSADKRTKAIIDTLENRRATKQQSENNNGLENCEVKSSQFASSPRSFDLHEEIVNEKVITYPKFVVVHDKQSGNKLDGKTLKGSNNGHDDTYGSARKQSKPRGKNNEQLRRDINARRSFKSYKTLKPQVYDQSNFGMLTKSKGQSMESLYKSFTPDSDFIMGFYPDEMQDYLQAKAIGTAQSSRSASKQRLDSRNESPGYPGPPPTPASALLMSFGIDPENREVLEAEIRNEIWLDNEHRRQMRERITNRDKYAASMKQDGTDPGVSHTTHRLLESKLVKQNFAFPDISPEMQRKAVGRTTRVEDVVNIRRSQSPVRPKTIGGGMTSHAASTEKLPNLDENLDKGYHNNESNLRLSQSQEVLNGSNKDQPQMKRAKTVGANNITRSNTFVQNKDKYSKLVSMGLPKVTIDIEKNHFSQGNITRRSLLLREKFEIKDLRGEHLNNVRRSVEALHLTTSIDVSQTDENDKSHVSHVTLAIDIQAEKAKAGLRKPKIKTQTDIKTDPVTQVAQVNQQTKNTESSQIKFEPPTTPDHIEKRAKMKSQSKLYPEFPYYDGEVSETGQFRFKPPPNTPEYGERRPKSRTRRHNNSDQAYDSEYIEVSRQLKFKPPTSAPVVVDSNSLQRSNSFRSPKKKTKSKLIKTQVTIGITQVKKSVSVNLVNNDQSLV